MTFRSLATLLGGVPADTSDTPGEPVGTRFVGFGEALTSAIANRPHHGLGENTDALNTRMVPWETSGLDAAYDLGAAGVPGGGRTITKDAGAIETQSILAVQYADDPANAHYRANMSGDTLAGGTGFESVGSLARPVAGFVDRTPLDLSDDTIIAGAGNTATLNPGGGGADRIRLDGGGRWKLGANTNLALTFEVVEVTGAPAGENGLYVLLAFVSDAIATFRKLDGTAASFTVDAAVTATLYRRKFASAQIGAGTLFGSLFHGEPGDTAALMLLAGQSDPADPTGADNALLTAYRDADGLVFISQTIDAMGRLKNSLPTDFIDASEDVNFGLYGHYVDKFASAHGFEAGFIYRGKYNLENYALALLQTISNGGTFAETEVMNITAVATIDMTGGIGDADLYENILDQWTVIEIVTPTTEAGFYVVDAKAGGSGLTFTVKNLDGTTPTFAFPSAGTIRFYSGLTSGLRTVSGLNVAPPLNSPTTASAGAVLAAPSDADSVALVLTAPSSDPDQSYLRCFQPVDGSPPDRENFRISALGQIETALGLEGRGSILLSGPIGTIETAGSGDIRQSGSGDVDITGTGDFRATNVASDYLYAVGGRTKTIMLPLAAGFDVNNATPTPGWLLFQTGAPAFRLSSQVGAAEIVWPLSAYLPAGAEIIQVRAKLRPGEVATRAVANRMELIISDQDPIMGTPLSSTPGVTLLSIVEDGTSTAFDRIVIDSGAISIDVNLTDSQETNLAILAGDSAPVDGILGIEITYRDPGPRNVGE